MSMQKAALILGMAGMLGFQDLNVRKVGVLSKSERVSPKDKKTKARRSKNKAAAKSRARNRK